MPEKGGRPAACLPGGPAQCRMKRPVQGMHGQCSRPPRKGRGGFKRVLPPPPPHTHHVTDASQNKDGEGCRVVVVHDQKAQSRRRHYSRQREEVGDGPYVLLQSRSYRTAMWRDTPCLHGIQ